MTIHVSEAKLNEGLTSSALHSVLPMIIWAAHFFVSYASAEVACALNLYRLAVLDVSAPRLWLCIISAVTIAALVGLTVRAVRHGRSDAESGTTAATVRIGAAVLALVGVLWSSVPIAFADAAVICGAAR